MAGLCGNNWKTRVLILFFLFISFRSNWQLGLTNFNKYALWAWKMVLLSFPFCLKVLFRCRALFFFFHRKLWDFLCVVVIVVCILFEAVVYGIDTSPFCSVSFLQWYILLCVIVVSGLVLFLRVQYFSIRNMFVQSLFNVSC